MVKTFTTFSSCSSRDIFNSKINPGYKEFFKIGRDSMSVSLVSLMSKPISFDPAKVELDEPDVVKRIKDDFEKNYLKILKQDQYDYLVMDTYYDVEVGVIKLENSSYITNIYGLPETEFYKSLKNFKIIRIYEQYDEFYSLFTKSCDLFFKFLKENCPNTKVILNCSRFVYKYLSNDKILENRGYYNKYKLNIYRDKLDNYILENYDVYVLPFDKNTVSDENHLWGLHPTHYEPRYYKEKTEQLKNIIQHDYLLSQLKEHELNLKKIRENEILKLQKNLSEYESKRIATKARVDIINKNNANNTIDFIDISNGLNVIFPGWFKSDEGTGAVIETEGKSFDLKIKCINDGLLRIVLRGPDVRDELGNFIPCYVDFNVFRINNENIINDKTNVWHNNPYIFEKNVSDGEIIELHFEWSQFKE